MLFLLLILSFLVQDVYLIIYKLLTMFNSFINDSSVILHMSSTGESSGTKTTVIHSNDVFQGIKSIFIYGTGALRFQLLRSGGTPLQRGFVLSSTIALDTASTALKNSIN